MQTTKTSLKNPIEVLNEELLPPDKLGVYASADILYKGTVFGRDSLEVAEDLLHIRPDVVEGVLLKLASLQGNEYNSVTEEEPGKIHHEHRCIDGIEQGSRVLELFQELSRKWGGNGREMTYYGSIDSTPLFVRLALNYAKQYEVDLERLEITGKDGRNTNLGQAVKAALDWLERKCRSSKSGMLEYQALNPQGLINQAWKDSKEFYIHSDGSSVNHARPVASIEVQGYLYDAFNLAGQFIDGKSDDYDKLKANIQGKVLSELWLEDERYFALGLDYDSRGCPRVIEVITANPATLLDSGLLEDLPEAKQRNYITGIIDTVFSDDFFTPAGIRSRALRHGRLLPIWDYHGSFVTWPKETYDIARGLERHGFAGLAGQLKYRLVNLVNSTGDYPEFVYVDKKGGVLYNQGVPGGSTAIPGTNHPESPQAWTVSALTAIFTDDCRSVNVKIPTWKSLLEERILTSIPLVGDETVEPVLLLTPFQLKRDN